MVLQTFTRTACVFLVRGGVDIGAQSRGTSAEPRGRGHGVCLCFSLLVLRVSPSVPLATDDRLVPFVVHVSRGTRGMLATCNIYIRTAIQDALLPPVAHDKIDEVISATIMDE
ncbi:hypothetical protein J3458_008701 [Metarhizium acridum]|uniref:uncharacterized protein n=1 Tax=Metarhizium acridum TaxID=92637 RepID=UPI001C6BD9D1|nr:hypothetical protein J3458_008701 [Metarhizium acridum]